MADKTDLDLQQVEPDETFEHGNAHKAEWVALMCLIAKHDRDLYRELRAEAWESVGRSGPGSEKSN